MQASSQTRHHRDFNSEELHELNPQKIAEAYRQAGYFELPKDKIPAWLLDDDDRESVVIFTDTEGVLGRGGIPISLNKSHEDWESHMTSLIWGQAETFGLTADDVYGRFLKYSNR